MTPESRVEVEELIFNQPATQTEPSTAQSQDALCSDYTNCQIAAQEMKQQNLTVYRMIKEWKLSVLKFWLSRGDVWPNLQKLAKKVFGLVASSAASESNCSKFGFIHSKLRHSLSPEAVEKLVYIKTNNVQFISQQNHICKNVDDERVEMLLGGSRDGDNEDESSMAAAMN
jgi:hAT family C-terminal dimerisation region